MGARRGCGVGRRGGKAPSPSPSPQNCIFNLSGEEAREYGLCMRVGASLYEGTGNVAGYHGPSFYLPLAFPRPTLGDPRDPLSSGPPPRLPRRPGPPRLSSHIQQGAGERQSTARRISIQAGERGLRPGAAFDQ